MGTAVAWLKTPAGGVAVLILATLLARLLFAAALGLGIDESYMVAAGRKLQLSYFDHPPIAWWMAWAAAHLTGSESAVVVRLPFIALFAVTTFLMYRVTSASFSPAAGLMGGSRAECGSGPRNHRGHMGLARWPAASPPCSGLPWPA